MFDEFASVRRRQALIDFPQEPVFVVDEPFYRFLHQRLRIAALLRGDTRKLRLQIGIEMHFHAVSLCRAVWTCQTWT